MQIVVVQDSGAARKIPAVPGLLGYRKDTEKLYLRSKDSWNVIAEEGKVTLYEVAQTVLTRQPNLHLNLDIFLMLLINTSFYFIDCECATKVIPNLNFKVPRFVIQF